MKNTLKNKLRIPAFVLAAAIALPQTIANTTAYAESGQTNEVVGYESSTPCDRLPRKLVDDVSIECYLNERGVTKAQFVDFCEGDPIARRTNRVCQYVFGSKE